MKTSTKKVSAATARRAAIRSERKIERRIVEFAFSKDVQYYRHVVSGVVNLTCSVCEKYSVSVCEMFPLSQYQGEAWMNEHILNRHVIAQQ